MAITPHLLIRFASEYMRWKALLKGFPLNGVLSTTTCDRVLKYMSGIGHRAHMEYARVFYTMTSDRMV
jgi:hypothetical protein